MRERFGGERVTLNTRPHRRTLPLDLDLALAELGKHLREVRKFTAVEAELTVHVAAAVTAYLLRILSQPRDGSADR